MEKPSPKKAPKDIFLNTVRYFPTVSINTIIRNPKGEVLFIKRDRQPAKDKWWIPGGRVLLGESMKEAAIRIVREEVGLTANLVDISDRYLEEFFKTDDYSPEDFADYAEDISMFHYIASVALFDCSDNEDIVLDNQSSDYRWSATDLTDHEILRAYFDEMTARGHSFFS